jgi:hypothetical protein
MSTTRSGRGPSTYDDMAYYIILYYIILYYIILYYIILYYIVSLTSGLPMVRQGLRSLQNGRASIPHYPPPSPKSREAERPGSRKAEKPKGGNPGSRGPKRPRCRLCLSRSDETSCAFTSYYRYATMPYGMPRHRGHVATRTSRVLSSLFSSQSFAFA